MFENIDGVIETRTQMKMRAAQRAIGLVESGMTVGLGSGSTASMWIHLLGERVRNRDLQITAVASSEGTERIGRSYGIPFVTLDECDRIDLTVDGADEIAPGLALIKGKCGTLLREKIIASASKVFVIVADSSKVVNKLGKSPLPVEVIPAAASLVSGALRELGFTPKLRRHRDGGIYVTDHQNHLLDCMGVTIEDPYQMVSEINAIAGVVEHGIFLDMVNFAVIANEDGLVERRI